LKETTCPGLTNQLSDINSMWRRGWNVATYEWKVYNTKTVLTAFDIKFNRPSLSIGMCMSIYAVQSGAAWY